MSEMINVSLSAEEAKMFMDVDKKRPKKVMGRLRDDWAKNKVLLNWVSFGGTNESGLGDTLYLDVSPTLYSGYISNSQRTFNRDTLEYLREVKQSSEGDAIYWHTRKCVIIEKRVFEAERKKSAAATKAKQKI